MNRMKPPRPGRAILLHEGKNFFKGWAAKEAYIHWREGERPFPDDITEAELAHFHNVMEFFRRCDEHGVELPRWDYFFKGAPLIYAELVSGIREVEFIDATHRRIGT